MIGDRVRLTPVDASGRIQTDAVGKKFLDWLWLGKGGRDRRWTGPILRERMKVSNDVNLRAVV
jgi:hypothetical protein